LEDIREHGHARNLQYAQMGVFLCAHCHILLALWDGKYRDELGGTGQVVRFHHDDIMPGYAERSAANQQMLVDDESDLVYHIVCSRDRPDGKPHDDFRPLDAWWFTKDENSPRTRTLPPQHELIFERGAAFSRDAVEFADEIGESCYPLYDPDKIDYLPDGIETIHYLFCIADWLAIHFQKRVLFTLKATHVLAFLMGLSFILYTELASVPMIMFLFLGFFAATFGLQRWAIRSAWNRKYLDYRTLAEGLRVQFYWAAAGVNDENESKFTHDNFLQTQDPELGWIRNVMRVAGTRVDAAPRTGKRALQYVLREWIGDQDSGQLGYYRKKSVERIVKSRNTERWSNIGLVLTIGIVLALLFVGEGLSENVGDILLATMGAVLLSVGIRQGYAYSTGEQELIKQYDFMLRIFNNARRRLNNADSNQERRQILRALGGSCLDEHAEWILLHRDRSIEQSEIWRSGI
ncbi:MAG: hypothetical protein R3315_13290, partial [Woeseiaceae bacterium]|nr:hypothetical protein [Woeseiaceae bacterium]